MSYALVDNATLTAVQRILGEVPVRSRNSIDVDLLAYENYVQARLFYDEVVVIDDYISSHRDSRKSAFPRLTFVDPDTYKLRELAAKADAISAGIRPKIQAGQFANAEFKSLLELLQTHMICTWDVASSIYHLNLKVLAARDTPDFEKYGAVATAIFHELSDARDAGTRVRRPLELVDRFGQPIEADYLVPGAKWGRGQSGPPSGAVSAFSASLVWLANRAVYYTLVAAHLKADSFLYPIRQAYQQHYLAQSLRLDADFPKRIVTQLSSTLSRDVMEIHNGGAAIVGGLDLPVFSAWLMERCGDTSAALFALEDIRLEPAFVEARSQLNELRETRNDGTLLDANKRVAKLTKHIMRVSSTMREKYSIKTRQGVPITRLVTVYNGFAALHGLPPLPKIDVAVRVPQWLRDMKREIGFCAVFRNIVNDLATLGALGPIRDMLGARVQIDEKSIAYYPKAEDPAYQYAHSPFKSPM